MYGDSINNPAAFPIPSESPYAAPSVDAEPPAVEAKVESPLVRFARAVGEIAGAAWPSIADKGNQANALAWLKTTYGQARETPAEDVAVAILRAVVIASGGFTDVLSDGLKAK